MKKIVLTLLGVLAIACNVFAQQTESWCGTDRLINEQIAKNPNYQQVLHNSMMAAAESSETGSARAVLTIPVVVHIIHDNGNGNISQEQIEDAIRILNEDYQRMNPDTVDTRNTANAPFVMGAGSMDIEFILAKTDPWNNCTNGVVRVNAPHLTYNANESCKSTANGGSSPWDQTRYMNIWVVNSIDNDGGSGMILGYAYLPYGNMASGYGILIRHNSFGTIETASSSDGRTLTHEMGHSLGLVHIFNAGWAGANGCHTSNCNQAGDYCCDTPTQKEPSYHCNLTWNSCTSIPSGDTYGFDTYDQIENYMSYNPCQNMFSKDQASIMEYNLGNVSWLINIVSDPGSTGVFDSDALCKAEFYASSTTNICVGNTVDLTDFSFDNPTTWSWTVAPGIEGVDYNFVNGTNANSQDPSIQFLTAGSYSLTLTVSDGLTSVSETKNDFIVVLQLPGDIDLIEGFEAYTSLDNIGQWRVYNPSGNAWELTSAASHTGVNSVRLLNFGQPPNHSDELISAPVDLSVINAAMGDEVTLSFRYSYRKRYPSNMEWLKIFISADCGQSWAQRKTLFGDLLSPLTQTSSWIPSTLDDWTTVHMTNITSTYYVENFLYKFEFESDGGNNIWLDNINIYKGPPSEELVGIETLNDDINGYNLYPNPASDQLNVRFDVANGGTATVSIVDITGKAVGTHRIQAAAGSNIAVIDTEKYASGVYFVNLTMGGVTRIEQLVIE